MTLRNEIAHYIDGNGLVAPNSGSWQPGQRGSDNGPMFTSEYYIMLLKNGLLVNQDLVDYAVKIQSCVGQDGELHRYPGDTGPDEVDDYYGVYSGMKNLELEPAFKLPFRLWRQPQLAAAMVSAKFPSFKNPLHCLVRLVSLPLYFVAAATLLISCWNAPASDTDARRLSWHLWQATGSVSLMCWLAGKIWLHRLYGIYPNGMKEVAALYYQPGHPFAKYWIT